MGWKHCSIVCLAYLATISISIVLGFKEQPPSYHYETLPKTSFSCRGKVAGRYYADPETECQLFHVCVQMSSRDLQDFKFLCPNGTSFDQEHQVCMDYYQVVCHTGQGNPLGTTYELFKLSSLTAKNSGLDSDKYSGFVDPDVAEKNTLGDDFQVQEYNNNKLAAAANSLGGFNTHKSVNKKSTADIFYKTFGTTKYTTPGSTTTFYTTTTTTRPPTTSTVKTTTPLLFRSPLPTNATVTTAAKRKPNLETYESYEIESVAGLTPQNSFNRLAAPDSQKHYEYSYEAQDPEPTAASSTTTTTSTSKPVPVIQIYHNTFRSPLPASSSTASPPVQTFQQQASRFNEDFFRKLPVAFTTEATPVSKAAQFYVQANGKYSTPYAVSTTTTEIPRGRSLNGISYNNNVGFSSIKPPTTAEPHQVVKTFQKLTTAKPDKYSIFYSHGNSKSTTKDYYSNVKYVSSTEPAISKLEFGRKSTTFVTKEPSTTTTTETFETTTESLSSIAPSRRGTRRRVSRPRSQQTNVIRKFDPELKYMRRVEGNNKNTDEIFTAEASVFPGVPAANLFEKEIKTKSLEKSTEAGVKLGENFGRRIRVNTRRQHFAEPKEVEATTPTTTAATHRRLVKRLKLKTTTEEAQSTTTELPSTTPTSEPPTSEPSTTEAAAQTTFFPSTLRPVKRINVKTKIGFGSASRKIEKDSFKIQKITSTSTTPEPELVTASDDQVQLLKKLKNFKPLKNSSSSSSSKSNSSSTVFVKVVSNSQPISFSEPILPHKKVERIESSRVEVSRSESNTQSPDYDYAYYNSEDDYSGDVASKLSEKGNYGKKPSKKSLNL